MFRLGGRAVAPQPEPGSVGGPAPGCHAGSVLSAPPLEIQVMHFPSGGMAESSGPPPWGPAGELRSLSNAIRAPSGDQDGLRSSPLDRVSRCGPEPSTPM